MLSIFETEGVWKVRGSGLVHSWHNKPTYVHVETDVPFDFGPPYHYGLTVEERDEFVRKHKIQDLKEIIEIFREPTSDMDGTFRGRSLLIASFANINDALMFKLFIPSPNPRDFRVHL